MSSAALGLRCGHPRCVTTAGGSACASGGAECRGAVGTDLCVQKVYTPLLALAVALLLLWLLLVVLLRVLLL